MGCSLSFYPPGRRGERKKKNPLQTQKTACSGHLWHPLRESNSQLTLRRSTKALHTASLKVPESPYK